MMNIELVKLNDVDRVFPLIASHFARALARNGPTNLTLPYLHSECSARRAFLFVDDEQNPKNGMIIRFEPWDAAHVCNVMAVAGEGGADWNTEMEKIKALARMNGANKIIFEGRKAWARAIDGAEPVCTRYAIELD